MVEMTQCESMKPANRLLSSCRWFASVFFLCCGFVTGPLPMATVSANEPVVGDEWIEVSSPHFTVLSNSGRRQAVRITGELEELRGALARLSPREPVEGIPVVVFLFENDRDFEPYKYLENGRSAVVSGFFRAAPEANFIALDGRAGYDSGVVFHEYVHCWLSRTPARLPLWVEEGLAELYQTFSVVGTRVQFGKPIDRHLAWLRNHPVIPLEELLAVDHGDPLYTEKEMKPGFYAQSWALVHLLALGDPARTPQLQQYLDLLAQGSDHQAAFHRAFGGDTDTLEDELDRYVQKKIFRIFSFDLEIESSHEIEVRPASQAEVWTRLGELLLSEQPPRSDAGLHFRKALEVDGNNGRALVGLARVAENERRWREADALYARALAVAPDDPTVLYFFGDALVSGRGDTTVAVRVLSKSVELDPEFGPAWSALADALLEAGEPAQTVLAAARTANRLLPHDRDATWDLLAALVRAGLWDEARSFVDGAFEEQAVDRGRALRFLVQRGLEKAHELIASEACDRAALRCDWSADQMSGADGERMLGEQLRQAREAVVQCRLVEEFRSAVAAFDEGRKAAARAQMIGIAEQAPESDLGLRALRFVDRIDHPDLQPEPNSQLVISTISQEELDLVNARLADQEFVKAMEILVELRTRSGPSESVWIDSKIAEVQKAIDHNRYVEQFNRGVDLYNTKAYAAAVEVLEALVRETPATVDTSSARSLLARARAAERR